MLFLEALKNRLEFYSTGSEWVSQFECSLLEHCVVTNWIWGWLQLDSEDPWKNKSQSVERSKL